MDGHARSQGTRSTLDLPVREAEHSTPVHGSIRPARRDDELFPTRVEYARFAGLELLNGTLANNLAGAFAERIRKQAGTDSAAQVELAYQLATGRPPNPKEKERAIAFLKTGSLKEFALAVFNLNAFLYVN